MYTEFLLIRRLSKFFVALFTAALSTPHAATLVIPEVAKPIGTNGLSSLTKGSLFSSSASSYLSLNPGSGFSQEYPSDSRLDKRFIPCFATSTLLVKKEPPLSPPLCALPPALKLPPPYPGAFPNASVGSGSGSGTGSG